jgi:tripartite-type tricarboxylate transporter receptor subunit TctC
MTLTRRTALTLAASVAVAPGAAFAQNLPAMTAFPSKQIRIVVPYPAGGPTDALARIVAADLQIQLGQTVIVENKPGASGAVGTREVAKADADGHTLVLSTNQTHVTNVFLLKEPGYDPVKDFVPVAGLADLQHALVVRKDLAVSSVADLVALAKKDPGKLNYGSTGVGSGSHLTMELFKALTGTQMTHVPFRGAAPMTLEIVAGRIDVSFATLPSVLGQIQGGEIKAMALASGMRAPQLPDVPLLKELGVANAEGDAWLALFAPSATPPGAVAILSAAVIAALAKPDVRANAIKQGIAVNVRDSKAFQAYHAAEMLKWSDVIKAAHVGKLE